MASIAELQERLASRFPEIPASVDRGELTLHLAADQLIDVLAYVKDDEVCAAQLLSDLSGVHWPAGDEVIARQPGTTGWPDRVTSREEGVIDVLYVLRSLTGGHRFRLAVRVSDVDPVLPSSTEVYPNAANFHEREVFDMFGVTFEGHPDLTRILMPDDWIGHPHRKDYPLGGIEIPYKNDKHIPPPNERDLREVVGSERRGGVGPASDEDVAASDEGGAA